MMGLIETLNRATLAAWTVHYVKEYYLKIYEAASEGHTNLQEIAAACEEYLNSSQKSAETRPFLKEATQIARSADDPVMQASARAIAATCIAVQTPANALGFLFYGAAAFAYSEVALLRRQTFTTALPLLNSKKPLIPSRKLLFLINRIRQKSTGTVNLQTHTGAGLTGKSPSQPTPVYFT